MNKKILLVTGIVCGLMVQQGLCMQGGGANKDGMDFDELRSSATGRRRPSTPGFVRASPSVEDGDGLASLSLADKPVAEIVDLSEVKSALQALVDLSTKMGVIYIQEAKSKKESLNAGDEFTRMQARAICIAGQSKTTQQESEFLKLIAALPMFWSKKVRIARRTENKTHIKDYDFDSAQAALEGIANYCDGLVIQLRLIIDECESIIALQAGK